MFSSCTGIHAHIMHYASDFSLPLPPLTFLICLRFLIFLCTQFSSTFSLVPLYPLLGRPAPPLIESVMIPTTIRLVAMRRARPRTAGCEFRGIVSVEHFPASVGWYVRYWVSKLSRASEAPLFFSSPRR